MKKKLNKQKKKDKEKLEKEKHIQNIEKLESIGDKLIRNCGIGAIDIGGRTFLR